MNKDSSLGRTIILILALFVFLSSASAQEIENIKKGVVKVKTASQVGTGFIVRLAKDAVFIITASHVVEGERDIKVEFFTSRGRLIPAEVIDMEGGDEQGLATLTIQGEIPSDLVVLRFNPLNPVRAGDPVTTIGFPGKGGPWAVTKGEIVGRKGKTIIFSGAIDKGNSGGPLLKEGQVIGVVTSNEDPFSFATPAVIAQYILDSWGIRFGDRLRSKPARLEKKSVGQMIRAKGFHHPYDLSEDGLSGFVPGNFQHEYELMTINGDDVVVDHATRLMWQQSGASNWLRLQEAEGFIAELNKERYAGFSDWRLPTLEELASLLEPIGKNEGLYIDPIFDSRQGSCWSADTILYRGPQGPFVTGWFVDFRQGYVSYRYTYTPKDAGYLAAAARGIRSEPSVLQEGQAKPMPARTQGRADIGSKLKKTRIAFVSMRDGNPEIYIMNADGTNVKRLTDNDDDDYYPLWSPDGKTIAFYSCSKGRNQVKKCGISVIGADGTNQKRLTNFRFGPYFISWSPNGKKIVFQARGAKPSMYVINVDGTDLKAFGKTHHDTALCSWSPDGTKFAYWSTHEGMGEIYVMSVDDTTSKRLTNTPKIRDKDPSWWPDENKIAFESDGKMYVMDADGTDPIPLPDGPVPEDQVYTSPDRMKILFESDRNQIYTMDINGTNPKRLTNTPAPNDSPSWSPDSKKIAFASERYGNWEIYMMNADGTNPIRLTKSPDDDTQPAWSPFLE